MGRSVRHFVLVAAVLMLSVCISPLAPVATAKSERVRDQYIIVLRENISDVPGKARGLSAQHGLGLQHVYEHAFKGFTAAVPPARLAALQADPNVEFIEQDQLGERAEAEWALTGFRRIGGDPAATTFSDGMITAGIAIIDDGIDKTHEDLNVRGGYNCTSTNRSDYSDPYGHGTHVAGVVAAKNNGFGVLGVAPGAPLYAVRVTRSYVLKSDVICGINWVTANAKALGIKVANISLTFSGKDDGNCGKTNADSLHKAICSSVAQGVTYVVAAGNSTIDFAGTIPAAYDSVLTVTAIADYNGTAGGGAAPNCSSTDIDDTAADFSNFAKHGSADANHTIAAPGVCIVSTWKGNGYAWGGGTSMAAPFVAGVAARCITTTCSGLTPVQVMGKLRADAAAWSGSAAQPTGNGYTNDPNTPLTVNGITRYYGYLANAGGY